MVDRQNAQNFVLPCSLDSALSPKPSPTLLPRSSKDLHEGANHSNIDGSRMNVQRDLACVARFQSRLRSLKYLWWHTGRWQLAFNTLVFMFSLMLLPDQWHSHNCLVERQSTVMRFVFVGRLTEIWPYIHTHTPTTICLWSSAHQGKIKAWCLSDGTCSVKDYWHANRHSWCKYKQGKQYSTHYVSLAAEA